MTLEYLEVMEDVKRKKCRRSTGHKEAAIPLTSEIDKCFVINEASVLQLK